MAPYAFALINNEALQPISLMYEVCVCEDCFYAYEQISSADKTADFATVLLCWLRTFLYKLICSQVLFVSYRRINSLYFVVVP